MLRKKPWRSWTTNGCWPVMSAILILPRQFVMSFLHLINLSCCNGVYVRPHPTVNAAPRPRHQSYLLRVDERTWSPLVDSRFCGHDGAVVIEVQAGVGPLGGAVVAAREDGGGRGGAPVHPEWPDASSGCIEGPAQLNVWGGADANYSRQDFERPPSLNTCTRPREWTPQYICATLAADKLDATRRVLASYLLSLEAENRRASEARANHLNHQITRITVQTFPVNA